MRIRVDEVVFFMAMSLQSVRCWPSSNRDGTAYSPCLNMDLDRLLMSPRPKCMKVWMWTITRNSTMNVFMSIHVIRLHSPYVLHMQSDRYVWPLLIYQSCIWPRTLTHIRFNFQSAVIIPHRFASKSQWILSSLQILSRKHSVHHDSRNKRP